MASDNDYDDRPFMEILEEWASMYTPISDPMTREEFLKALENSNNYINTPEYKAYIKQISKIK